MKVFIIDDDKIYRVIVSKMLKIIDSSIAIEESENGEMGLASLKNQNDLNQKIIVLLDINMPIINGWEFLELIEKNDFFKLSHLKIYMVSSSTDESDILKAKQYEFISGFIHKPLSRQDIEEIIMNK